MKQVTLHIEGMSCGHCLNAVKQALAAVPGVVVEELRIGRALVAIDESRVTPAAVEAAVTGAGYRATAAAG